MKKLFHVIFCIFIVNITQAQTQNINSKIELLETWLEAQRTYKTIPGISIAIISDNKTIYANGFGLSDIAQQEKTSSETLYRIASITKVFTCTAIMQLRDKGLLSLHDEVQNYLPWFKIKQIFPDSPHITIWHIMTHTSGLPREAAFPYWTDHKFPTMNQIKNTISNQSTLYRPAEKYQYSNLGISLLGEVIEKISGTSYENYIRSNILIPLEMKNTYVNLDENIQNSLSKCYTVKRQDGSRRVIPVSDTKGLVAAANMSSNVLDLAKFIAFNLNAYNDEKQSVLNKSSIREMHRLQWINKNWNSGRGIGYSISKMNDMTIVGHGGWIEAFRSQILFCPEKKIGVVVMTNADDATPAYFTEQILQIIIQDIKNDDSAPPSPIKAQWKKYKGLYKDPWEWYYKILIINNQLYLYSYNYPPEDNPLNSLTHLTYLQPHVYQFSSSNDVKYKLVFEIDENDNVYKIKKGENYIFPVQNE